MEFANGAVGSLLGSYDSSYAYPLTHYLEVNGTSGRAFVEDTVKRLTLSQARNETSQAWQAGYFNDIEREFHRTFDRHVDELIRALVSGGGPPADHLGVCRSLWCQAVTLVIGVPAQFHVPHERVLPRRGAVMRRCRDHARRPNRRAGETAPGRCVTPWS